MLLIPCTEESMSSETKSKRSPRRRSLFRLAGIKSSSSTRRIGRCHHRFQGYASDRNTLENSMTAGAQQALRRTMEIYSNTTRFCLACNMANKIIEPIQSRCAILRYAKLRDPEILKRLLEICESEKVLVATNFSGSTLTPLVIRSNTTTTVLRRSSSHPRETCVRPSTISNQPGRDSGSSLLRTYLKSVTNPTQSSFKPFWKPAKRAT